MSEYSQERLENKILETISSLIVKGSIKNHNLNTLVSITRVELSPDNSSAKVYVSYIYDNGVLEKLSTSEIKLNVIRASAGAIIESDITLASASNAVVIGFNVRPTPRAQALANEEKVEIKKYNIIYDVVDDIKAAMEGMLSPETREVEIGKVEVRDTFKVPKVGIIAGCMVTEGKIKRNSLVRVIRDNIQISQSLIKISSLKRFKDDAKDVLEGFECGVGLENWQDLQVGDILEVVETEEVKRTLEFDE